MTWIPDNSIREEACRGNRGVTGLHNTGSERSFSAIDTPVTVGIASVIRKRTEVKEKSRRILADYDRLKYADNRFVLTSKTHRTYTAECMTTWRVDNRYDFEGFKGKDSKWSEFPFRGERIKIYDGLSKYLVELEIAAEFEYWASWQERWEYSGR